jgi:hypothetical protein
MSKFLSHSPLNPKSKIAVSTAKKTNETIFTEPQMPGQFKMESLVE